MDISKCTGVGCPKAERCYRYTAPASKAYQSYLSTPPFRIEEGKTVCDLFWKDRTVKDKTK